MKAKRKFKIKRQKKEESSCPLAIEDSDEEEEVKESNNKKQKKKRSCCFANQDEAKKDTENKMTYLQALMTNPDIAREGHKINMQMLKKKKK